MKKITLASIALVSLLFIGCTGDKPADANATETNVTEVNTSTEPAIQEENATVTEENATVADANVSAENNETNATAN